MKTLFDSSDEQGLGLLKSLADDSIAVLTRRDGGRDR